MKDDNLKKRLDEYESDLSAIEVWKSIQDRVVENNKTIAKNRQRKRNIKYLFGLLFLTLGVGVLYFYTNNIAPQTTKTATETPIETATTDESTIFNSPKTSSSISSLESFSDKKNDLAATDKSQKSLKTENTIASKVNNLLKHQNDAPIGERNNDGLTPIHQETTTAITTNLKEFAEDGEGSGVNQKHVESLSNYDKKDLISLPFLETKNSLVVSQKEIKFEGFEARKIDPISSLKSPVQFSIEAYGGAVYSSKIMTPDGSDLTGLYSLRTNTEKSLNVWNLGLVASAEHRSGFGLSSGINYTRINELFEHQKHIRTDTSEIVDKKYFSVRPNNDTIFINGTINRYTSYTDVYKNYNSFNLIDIPILLTWSQKINRNRIGIKTGVFANIKMISKGLNIEGQSLEVVSSDKLFKSQLGLSYYLGFDYQYSLYPNLNIKVSPHCRFFGSEFNAPENPINQNYRLFGINLGLVKNL